MAQQTKGGTWINVTSSPTKGHVNIYDNDPKDDHNSTHINIDYENGTFNITEKEDGEKQTTDGKCFLVTACMRHYNENFDNNCSELTILRWFRDNYVLKDDIAHYYEIAPTIVKTINRDSYSDLIYDYIYDNLVDYCVEQIKNGNYNDAYDRYINIVTSLENTFLEKDCSISTLKRSL